MKKAVSILLLLTSVLFRVWGLENSPYAEFGCQAVVLDIPAPNEGIFEYVNPDTSSTCRKVLLDTKLHIVAFLDRNDSVLRTAAVRNEAMLRWFVPDPANQYWSGYVGMGNNPVSLVDPDGRDTWQNGSGENKYFEAGTDPGSGWTHQGTDFQFADINATPQYSAHELTMMNPVVNNIHANTDQ